MQQKQYRNNYQQIELITYFLSIVILSLWCFIPAFVTARTGIKLQGLFSLEYYDDAIFFALKMIGVYSLIFFSYYLLNRKNYINNIKNRFLSNRSNSKTDNLVILYIVCSIILLFTLDLDAILNSSMRHVSSPILLNIQLVFLYIYFRLIIKKERNIYDSIFSSLVCITYLIYPIANSSRAVILPFAINILIILSTNRSKFRLIPNVLITATFLSSSLITRGDLGIGNFFNVIFNSNLDELSYAVISTLLGVGQVSVALDYFSINPTYDFFLFLLYLSPLPSGYLPEGIRKINFSTILDISYVGINTDIISEWVFFFGKTGWLYGGIFFALLVIIPFELIKRGHIKNFAQRLGFQISILYFFGAGYSMQLRAASRFFYYMIFITFIFNFLEKKQKLNNSFKINS